MEYKDDVVPGLLKSVQSQFQKNMVKNRKAASAMKKVEAGTATYKDVDRYAEAVGEALQDAFSASVSSSVLPDGHMYYNIADGLIQPTLETNHGMVAAVAASVQTQLNQSAGIGLKAVSPQLDQKHIDQLKEVAVSGENYDDVSRDVATAMKTYTQKVADASARDNFDFQSKAGLSPKIQRSSFGKCCKWCDNLAGTYDYEGVKKTGSDVYRRHARCNCIVEFIPADGKHKGKRQDVASKRWYSEEESEAIRERARELAEARLTKNGNGEKISTQKYVYTGGKRNEKYLTEEQKAELVEEARRQGYKGNIEFSDNQYTSIVGFQNEDGTRSADSSVLVIGTDAFPGQNPKTANEKLTANCCIAHEVVGHHEAWLKHMDQADGLLEEVQASLRASFFGDGLTDYERELLLQDALDRLEKSNLSLEDVKDKLYILER